MNLETFLQKIRVQIDDDTDGYKDSIFTSKNARLDSDILNIFEYAEFSEEYIDDENSCPYDVSELVEIPILEVISNDKDIKNQTITNGFQVLTNLTNEFCIITVVDEISSFFKFIKCSYDLF